MHQANTKNSTRNPAQRELLFGGADGKGRTELHSSFLIIKYIDS